LKRQRRIITDSQTVFRHFHQLEPGDRICCRLRIKPGEEHLLLDLAERGITGIPSFRSQWCSRSKAFQTRLFSWAMIPGSTVIYTIHDLIEAVEHYGRTGIGRVVLKLEGKNGGLGVLLFSSIEEIYNQAVLGLIPYPFVIQPFLDGARDLRVIIIDDYREAYVRTDAHGFRQNLHCGARAAPCSLTDEQTFLCRRIMTQGGFPYAHLDLLQLDAATTYFSEINLRGGLRGARITSDEYRRRIEAVHHRFIDEKNVFDEQ
jgi:glutathione synthase/RimK-type ligase-like ATP-grasp enzyme